MDQKSQKGISGSNIPVTEVPSALCASVYTMYVPPPVPLPPGVSIASCGLSKNPGIFYRCHIKFCMTGIWDTRNSVRWGHGELLDQSNLFSYQNYRLTEARSIIYVRLWFPGRACSVGPATAGFTGTRHTQYVWLSSLRVSAHFPPVWLLPPLPPPHCWAGFSVFTLSTPGRQTAFGLFQHFYLFLWFLILVNSL